MAFDAILDALGLRGKGQRVLPPVPRGRTVEIPGPDADDLVDETPTPAHRDSSAPIALFIVYRDSAGAETKRRITCKCYEADKGNLRAWCHERQAFRRFKLARVTECVIAATGEEISIAALAAMLPLGESPAGDQRLTRILTLLVFLMKCDGKAHAAEREVIEDAAGSYAMRFDGNDATVARAVRGALALAPDVDDAIAALRWIEASADARQIARLVLPFIDRVIEADGVIASQEAYFGGMLRDALSAILEGRPAF